MFYIVPHGFIHDWARKTVKEGRVVPRVKVFLAIFTLCLVSAAWVATVAYFYYIFLQLPLKGIVMCLLTLAMLSNLSFFPIYTLLKRRLISTKKFALTTLPIITLWLFVFWAWVF